MLVPFYVCSLSFVPQRFRFEMLSDPLGYLIHRNCDREEEDAVVGEVFDTMFDLNRLHLFDHNTRNKKMING